MYDQERYIKIPKNRIGALIGKNAKDKRELENLTKAKIIVDSETGDVTLIRNEADAFTFYRLEQVIKAIGRGFSPMHARLLLEPDYVFELINLNDFDIKTEKARQTKRGRVIGKKGTMRKFIEETLDCYVSVQGKTVGIIGKMPNIIYAKNAVESLLSGANIPAVKKQIQKNIMQQHNMEEF